MNPAENVPLRRLVYMLFITLTVGAIVGRIFGVVLVFEPNLHQPEPTRTTAAALLPLGAHTAPELAVLAAVGQQTWSKADPHGRPRVWPVDPPEPMPTFGSNDRSRWDTVRALVDHGTYAIGYRDTDPRTGSYHDCGIVTEDGWQTIDRVLKPAPAGETQSFYSSKPPLLPTLVAGEYWLLKHVFGWSIVEQRWLVIRFIVITWNVLPLVVYLLLLARLLDRYGTTDWGRLLVFATACFGTFLTTFAVTLNNHSIATYSALFALYPALMVWEAEEHGPHSGPYLYAVAGLFAGFAACCELPAASFLAALFGLLLVRAPRPTLLYFLPAAVLPIAGLLATNYLAIGQVEPAYSEFGGPWYEYPGSIWRHPPVGAAKVGIDWAGMRETKWAYALHYLVGHHGILSLTPIFLLAFAGMILAVRQLLRRPEDQPALSAWGKVLRFIRQIPAWVLVSNLSVVLTLTIFGFYFYKTSNYGGWTSGPRWFFWLTPFWLLSMLPIADWLAARRWGRGLAYVLLGLSALSVSYPAWNPWRHPWIYNWMDAQGWINY